MALALPGQMFYAPSVVAEENGTAPQAAPQSDAASGEAGRHFRRGVDLYSEANYTAALVEFKRAFALAPTATALYDLGETQFQLQDYAGALKTFRRYLAEFGPTESHRAAVAQAVEVLRARVGHLNVTTIPPGADVVIDDEAVGKTPLAEPLLVSVGRRKVLASMAGRGSVTEYVDIAAEDRVSVSLQMRAPAPGVVPAADYAASTAASAEVEAPRSRAVTTLRTAGWIATSTLAAGAITFGAFALAESRTLANERNVFPAASSVLHSDATRTATYSILADSFAAAAILVGLASVYWTLSPNGDHAAAASPQARVTLAPTSARFEMTF